MAEQETVTSPTPHEASRPLERRPKPERRRADSVPSCVPQLPAGIRWWEACGGWKAGYQLGVF
ncbi:hypothetical protein J2W21_002220 [Sinomonas atrocyanea]|uniref:hypothetical protein n=1 Tax=Sinomonas atrocyanea TaxID=37927 RepID=UPI002784310F|nr:hypothetical protein [Sinomonas atrocyanea]MDP9884706.1 hypothetical protein [Sinomonas atrocyanea]